MGLVFVVVGANDPRCGGVFLQRGGLLPVLSTCRVRDDVIVPGSLSRPCQHPQSHTTMIMACFRVDRDARRKAVVAEDTVFDGCGVMKEKTDGLITLRLGRSASAQIDSLLAFCTLLLTLRCRVPTQRRDQQPPAHDWLYVPYEPTRDIPVTRLYPCLPVET